MDRRLDELDSALRWVEAAWEPELTVGGWWTRLASARLAAPTFPPPWGRAWPRDKMLALCREMADRSILRPPYGMGHTLVAPTLFEHARHELVERFIPPIVDGRAAWCQLFSEPGAGSDLAGLQTRAVLDGDEWVVTGQKVWTSGGHVADHAILIARTDPKVTKHRGLTYFVLPMDQPGVEIGRCVR